jgi:hypothetical protein
MINLLAIPFAAMLIGSGTVFVYITLRLLWALLVRKPHYPPSTGSSNLGEV